MAKPLTLPDLKPFLEQHCFDCHGAEKQKGDIRLDTLGYDLQAHTTLEIWQGVLDQLNLGDMPPAKRPQPDVEDVRVAVDILTRTLQEAYAQSRSTDGQTVLRRLNRHELRNTFRDLLYLNGADYRPDAAGSRLVDNNGNGSVERTGTDPLRFFPEDEEDEGFFNLGDRLVMSDFLLKLTLGAVEEVLEQATKLGEAPKIDTRSFAGDITKAKGRHPEVYGHELFPEANMLYRSVPLRSDVLGRGLGPSGRYRISLEVSAYNQNHPFGELLPTNPDEPFYLAFNVYKARDAYPVTVWTVPADGRKRTLQAEAWIDAGWAPEFFWENGPTDREMRTDKLVEKYLPDHYRKPPDKKVITDKKEYDAAYNTWWSDLSVALLKDYKGPHIKVHRLTVEAVTEAWPPQSHTALYGSGKGEESEIRKLLQTFADRAFRRPVDPDLIEPYVQLVLEQKVEPVVTLPAGIKNLSYRLYNGKWDKIPDFDALEPVKTGTVENGLIDIRIANKPDYYGFVFEGELMAPRSGNFLFEMASDDGGRIRVNGETVLEHDGLHGAEHRKAQVRLEEGIQKFRVEYVAYGQPNSFRAGWGGQGLSHTPLTVDPIRNPKPGSKKPEDEVPLLIRALQDGYAAILCSPQFLYLKEDAGELDDYAIASRLSYFLWSSMPDDILFSLAKQGRLRDKKVLREQVERMLQDPKSAAFVRHFPSAWLRLDKLGKMPPSGGEFQFYKNLRVEPMLLRQVTIYFEDLLKENGPVDQLIHSDYTYMNQVLGKWIYRREDIRGNRLRKVRLDDPRRGGIFTQPGLMTATANGVETSPVIRGTWVLENVLGTPPPPPPPDVEPLPTNTRDAKTVRELLELHRKSEACYSCHIKIDPMGFAFENFDVVGRWRDKYKRARDPIDTRAVMANGTEIEDIVAFKQMLLERKHLVARCLIQKMVTYATGRHLEAVDRGEIDRITDAVAKDGFRVRDMVHQVVASEIFLSK